MSKTDAASATLHDINPDTTLESFHLNITTVEARRSPLHLSAQRL